MADTSKPQSLHLNSHDSQRISSQPTLNNNCITNSSNSPEDDDDIVNVDDEDASYIFNPFSPLNSSFFAPSSSSSSYLHDRNQQVNSNSCSCCSSEPEPESESESESDHPDSTPVYPDCLYGQYDAYDQMDFITDLFDSRGETEHVSNHIQELGLGYEGAGGGLRVVGIESESDTEELGDVVVQNEDTTQPTDTIEQNDETGGEATIGVVEWGIRLAVNNLERDLEIASDGAEGFVYTPEFDTLIGQFVETVRALRGSPPAAKSIVDNLPWVVLKMEDVEKDDNVMCAVCKDEIAVEEKVMQLPCKHHYHGDCIVPWLSIRNTCPVCRFELPTDDLDYERIKNRVDDDELRVGYGFDLSP